MAGAPRRVLVVDDDPGYCAMVRAALEAAGFEVLTAANGLIALTLVADRSPDVILLDLKMPSMSGAEFAACYRRLPGRHAGIILMSGARDLPAKALELGATAYVRKPFDLDRLVSLVDACD